MVRVNMEFEVDGEKQLSRFFEHASDEIPDFTGTFLDWAEDFRRTQHSVFVNEGAFEGRGRWEELSPDYREWKELHYPGRTILQRTDRLWNSLTGEGHTDHIFEYDESEFKIGTAVPYATFHQDGTPNMPQRKIIELTQPQRKRWVQICRKQTWGRLVNGADLHDLATRRS